MHSGDLTIVRGGRFDGMVSDTLTIAAGCVVEMAGLVNGALVLEPGADVLVSGMVNGGIVDRGGRVSVTGMVCG